MGKRYRMVGEGIDTRQAPPMSATSRLLGLDALRAVAAWLVLLSHVAFWTGAGAEGVVGGLAVRGDGERPGGQQQGQHGQQGGQNQQQVPGQQGQQQAPGQMGQQGTLPNDQQSAQTS